MIITLACEVLYASEWIALLHCQQLAMGIAIQQRIAPEGRRVLAGFGALVLFSVVFVLPLWSALAHCTMPCCEHGNVVPGVVVGPSMPGCAPQCTIRRVDATAPVVAIAESQRESHRASPFPAPVALLPDAPAPAVAFVLDSRSPHRSAGAPLHVLNATFRI